MSAALHNIDLIFLVWNFLIWSYTVFVGWFSARLLWDQYSVFKPHAHCMWLSSVFTAATLQCMNGTQSAVPVLSLTNIQGIPRLGCEHCCNGRFCTSILVPSSPAVRLLVSSALPDAAKPSSKALHTPGKSSTLLRVQSTFEKYIPHGRWFKKKKKKSSSGFSWKLLLGYLKWGDKCHLPEKALTELTDCSAPLSAPFCLTRVLTSPFIHFVHICSVNSCCLQHAFTESVSFNPHNNPER